MNGIKRDPDVKLEDAMSPDGGGYMDDDFYEDTGELQMPIKDEDGNMWLTRIPSWLYDSLSMLDNDAGADDDMVILGEVLAFQDQSGKIDTSRPMNVFFDEKWQARNKLPRGFELQAQKPEQLDSTYVFTEKDLPGFRQNKFKQGRGNDHGGAPGAPPQRRSKFHKAIPKHTALLGSPSLEFSALPLMTPEYRAFTESRARSAIQGSYTRTNIDDSMNEFQQQHNVQKAFDTFIKPITTAKSQANKAARIPKNELIDQLHACFDQYAFWPMKALKQRLNQPEAYLKEVLADIADLVKTGSFASCWRRSDMYDKRESQYNEMAPELAGLDDGDDDLEMEDVV